MLLITFKFYFRKYHACKITFFLNMCPGSQYQSVWVSVFNWCYHTRLIIFFVDYLIEHCISKRFVIFVTLKFHGIVSISFSLSSINFITSLVYTILGQTLDWYYIKRGCCCTFQNSWIFLFSNKIRNLYSVHNVHIHITFAFPHAMFLFYYKVIVISVRWNVYLASLSSFFRFEDSSDCK